MSRTSAIYGYTVAQTLVTVLKASGDNLTRENIMKQAASKHDLGLSCCGRASGSTRHRFCTDKHLQLMKCDGTTWR